MLLRVAQILDGLGLRSLVAKAASLAYPGQRFFVDEAGRWVNEQLEGTIVSPIIHTTRYRSYRDWALVHWTQYYGLKRGDIILDLGSGVGEEAVVFSRCIGPSGRMFAVEAHPGTFECLSETVRRSGLTNVQPVQCAVGDHDGTATISSGHAHLANSLLKDGDETVPMLTVDSLVAKLGIDRIDFFRTNIEGAERLMLGGMTNSAAIIRNLCISCHDFVADAGGDDSFRSKAAVLEWLQDNGFTVLTNHCVVPPARDNVYARR